MSKKFKVLGPIIDFGGRLVQPEYYGVTKSFFPEHDYKTFDLEDADIIGNIYDINLLENSVGTALCLEVLEHLAAPQKAIDEIRRVLVPGGLLVLTAPMCWELHKYPKDYWRFMPEGIEYLLRDRFVELDITSNTNGDTPGHIFVTARKI